MGFFSDGYRAARYGSTGNSYEYEDWTKPQPAATQQWEPPGIAERDAKIAEFREVLAEWANRDTQRQHRIAALDAEILQLRQELAQRDQADNGTALAADVAALLAFPGVRKALLHEVANDHHPNASTEERRARDEMMITLQTIYKRKGKKQ